MSYASLFALLWCLLLLVPPALAQPDLAGDWSGYIDASSVAPDEEPLLTIFHIVREGDGYAITFDSPDQGAFGLPMDSVTVRGDTLVAGFSPAGIVYTGIVDAENARIDGLWAQGRHAFPLVLTPYEASEARTESKPRPKARGDLSGRWTGLRPIAAGGARQFTLTLTRDDDGHYSAILDAAGLAENLHLDSVDIRGRSLVIDIMQQALFTGTISDDETTMDGTFSQGEYKVTMTLTRQ